MGVTAFGKILRKRRIDSSEILGDMAKRLNVSAAYLSSIENGLREIPDSFVEKISKEYGLSEAEKQELEEAQAQSKGLIFLLGISDEWYGGQAFFPSRQYRTSGRICSRYGEDDLSGYSPGAYGNSGCHR